MDLMTDWLSLRGGGLGDVSLPSSHIWYFIWLLYIIIYAQKIYNCQRSTHFLKHFCWFCLFFIATIFRYIWLLLAVKSIINTQYNTIGRNNYTSSRIRTVAKKKILSSLVLYQWKRTETNKLTWPKLIVSSWIPLGLLKYNNKLHTLHTLAVNIPTMNDIRVEWVNNVRKWFSRCLYTRRASSSSADFVTFRFRRNISGASKLSKYGRRRITSSPPRLLRPVVEIIATIFFFFCPSVH